MMERIYIIQILFQFKMINLHKLDPDWNFAKNHGQASIAGLKPSMEQNNQKEIKICRCCHQFVNKDQVGLWQHSKQLEFLGRGFPLFYQFLKICVILLVLMICSYNALSIHQALINNYELCHQPKNHRRLSQETNITSASVVNETTAEVNDPKHGQCFTFMIEIARIDTSVTPTEEAMRIISFVLHIFALMYFRNRINMLQAYYDERTTTLSDYSIFFKKLPLIKGIQKKLREFLAKEFKEPYQIKQITVLPEFQRIEQLEKTRKKLIHRMRKYYSKKQLKNNEQIELQTYQQDLTKIENQITQEVKQAKQAIHMDQIQCNKIICVFNKEQQKDKILDQFQQISDERKNIYFGQLGSKITAKEAPQPEAILWQNANISTKKRRIRIFIGWGLSILTIVLTFIIFYFIIEKKSLILEEATLQLAKHPDEQKAIAQHRGAVALVFIMMFLVVIFDKVVLAILFHHFTDIQKHTTTAKFQFSFALKFLIGLFFTTALMTLAVQAIRFRNYYTHGYGVIDQESIMFFMNSFFVPFFWLANPFRIFKMIKRKIHHKSRKLTQKQANDLMEQENYDMGKRFAQVVEMMWFTFLYSTLIPIGAVITCCGLIFYYWVDKYNLLRRSKITGHVSQKLVLTSMTLLDFTLILRPVGSIIFDRQIRQNYMNSNIIMIVIAFVYIITPKNKIMKKIINQKFKPEQRTFEEIKQMFHKTYHTEHPIYRQIYLEKLQSRYTQKGMVLTNHSSSQLAPLNILTSNSINKIQSQIQII